MHTEIARPAFCFCLTVADRTRARRYDIHSDHFIKRLSLRHLRVIAGLAEHKLVARVAQALNVTQPAVSKQINELEHIAGAPIVTRERNRLFLTPIGERLAEHARIVLGQIDRAAFDLDAMASGASGPVQVGVVASVAPILLPGAISLFKRSAPRSNVVISEGHFVSLFPLLEAGQIDLLIARIWQPDTLEGVDQTMLFSDPVVVVGGPAHPLANVEKMTWAQATDCPWILPQANSVARRAMEAMFAGHGLAPPVNIIASSALSLNIELLKHTEALGFFPASLARTFAARGDLVILPLDTEGLLSEVRCFWRSDGADQNSPASLFRKCLIQAASQR
ncbi:LysR substrate-binding domain-containing protein [Sulfitobacter sp. HNIBRBA3233]|uniref:LysR substrate-binding domain-containing protein n=1 Tax=Sulfitobacter marinivivus TaxID=3158558 RepID=UPI0032DF8FB0